MAVYWYKTCRGSFMTAENVEFIDMKPELASFRDEVLQGLSKNPKRIPPKFFYDDRGSELFVKITRTPEYYVTRTEEEILGKFGEEISETIGKGTFVIEYGSGNSEKTSMLISSLDSPFAYVLIDISSDAVRNSADLLSSRFPDLKIISICADYLRMHEIPEQDPNRKKVIVFLGSTIGNFEPDDAKGFLELVQSELNDGDGMLVGVDLRKDVKTLNAAYNDSEGYTARFNLNLLRRIGKELETDINPEKFAHKAYYNRELGRIEMHLVSLENQEVMIEGMKFRFDRGETIHTESSYKYTVEDFSRLAEKSGLKVKKNWQDSRGYFSLLYLTK